jgi:hypothetical protein
MICRLNRCSRVATEEIGTLSSLRTDSQGGMLLSTRSRICMSIGLLFVILGICHSSRAQIQRDYTYNPNHFDATKVIQAMKTPHDDLVIVSAHRGLHSVPGDNPNVPGLPENSLDAVGGAAQAGLEVLELDIKQTPDGQLTFSHDKTWGRQSVPANGSTPFNPFEPPAGQTAVNLPLATTPMTTLQANWVLRDSVTLLFPSNPQPPPTLQQVLAYYNQHQIGTVLAFDVKDVATFQMAWAAIRAAGDDFLGRPFYGDVIWKVSGNNFPTPAAFKAAFTGNINGVPEYEFINYWPVYNTADIAPGTETLTSLPPDAASATNVSATGFGSEQAIINSLNSFYADPTISIISAEITQKQPGGILDTVRQNSLSNGRTAAEFSATGDYFDPNDATHTAQFFASADGSCCQKLSQFYYNGAPNGQPSDTSDDRGSLSFVLGENFNIITADTALDWAGQLSGMGLRTLTPMQETGYGGDPHCNVGLGQYPGCNDANDPGTTVYTFCAAEGGTCDFPGVSVVAYGANGIYNFFNVNNVVDCNNANLGPDPVPDVVKGCYYGPHIGDPVDPNPLFSVPAVYCGYEGTNCEFNGTAKIIYGIGGRYASLNGHTSFYCSGTSGPFAGTDPAPGLVKTCFYQLESPNLTNGPAGYIGCANEGQTCTFSGAARVAFGANGKFSYRTFPQGSSENLNDGAPCDTTEFPDPNFGVVKACYVQWADYVSSNGSGNSGVGTTGGPGSGSNNGGGAGSGTGPCDLYASGGTPCVAAHSLVRALFGRYGGRLYQVKRASDNTTLDIGTLATGGYAGAAAQDTFCAGTTCSITIIYDQTSNHNDLPVTAQLGSAVANALPISANLNAVYGLKVTPGVGYRNNATTGVAGGSSPEGMYMVTSGTYVNSGCCFDYGNAETNSQDDGAGRMDALNFGTYCEFAPCSGSGPWVEADMENGQYMGNGNNPGDVSMGFDFVTAMLKNDGTSTFALKGGNAQSGALTTDYSGTLPTLQVGGLSYIPMNKQGAIILGTGGDNSDADLGSFFEGAITSGYPTDATENAVQANIVAAGYVGDSSGGSGGPGVVSEPPGPYTGPSDPGGPGPQDGFASPATEQPNDLMGSKPALASFNGSLFVAFQANDTGHTLHVSSSPTGYNFPAAAQQPNVLIGGAPAMAAFNNQLYIAFQANDAGHTLHVTSSPTGYNFPAAAQEPNILIGSAPAMAVFNDQLCISFQANDPGHTLHVTCSSDGVTWPTAWQVPNVAIGSAPAMTVFDGMLYIAFRADDPSNDVWIASSLDGVNFTSEVLSGQTMDGNSSPALVVSNNVLYYIYAANDTDHEMLVTTSADGSTWQGPAAYLGIQMGAQGPGAGTFGNGVSVGFQSNDSRNVLFVTNKVTEASSYTGPSDPNGAGPQDGFASTATEQPNVFMGSKPALASFNGSLYVAFQANDPGHTLHVTSSPTGSNFPAAAQEPNVLIGSAPGMAEFNHQLFIAFQANDPGHTLHVTSSSDGVTWPAAWQVPNVVIGGAPAMAVFNNQLYLAFQANDPSHNLFMTSSADGVNWAPAWQIPNIKIGSDPAMTVFNGELFVAFRANDPSNGVWIASSPDGINFGSQVLPGQTMGGTSAPALVASLDVLYYIYGANDLNNEMLVSSSLNGSNWQGPKAYLGAQMGAAGPGAAAFGNGVYAGFQSNDSRNVLFVTNLINNSSQITRPCNIFALASPATPCVAAFSTIRSLDVSYTGPLYQVTRESDNTAVDIGMLLDSYANAAAQDTFCAGTFCSITKIYDQTSNHNDLTAAPPGGQASGTGPNGYDLTAPATGVPLMAGGHTVYGIYSQPGYGYRNDATKGIATNGAPEGVYMVSSAKGLTAAADINGACCFDFGNAETTNKDDQAGHMDAMRLACIGTPCVPVAGLDMENGTYGNAPGSPETWFAIAMGWNDGQSQFGTYLGDVSTGNLSSTGTIPLPSGYKMQQEGAIILGIGGDNSNGGSGYFYEGAMTQGAPSSASLSSVMANAASVGYTLYTGSPAGGVEDGGTYTLENQASQMYLDNYCDGCSGAATDGVQIIQYPGNGWLTQKWTLHSQGNGYYTMVSGQSGMCLDDPWGNGTPSRTLPQSPGTSTMLWQQPCNGNAAQNWLFIPQSNGNFVIQNQAATTNNGSSMVLDVYNGLATQGMQMWLDTANGLPPQNWHLAHQ